MMRERDLKENRFLPIEQNLFDQEPFASAVEDLLRSHGDYLQKKAKGKKYGGDTSRLARVILKRVALSLQDVEEPLNKQERPIWGRYLDRARKGDLDSWKAIFYRAWAKDSELRMFVGNDDRGKAVCHSLIGSLKDEPNWYRYIGQFCYYFGEDGTSRPIYNQRTIPFLTDWEGY